MFGFSRRGVERPAPLLAALLVVAPLSAACAQVGAPARQPSPLRPGVDLTTPPASAADQLGQSFQDIPGDQALQGEGFGDGASPDPMDPRIPAAAANYGKPVIWKPGRKPRKKAPFPALPPLAPYPTSAEARRELRRERTPPPGDPDYLAPAPTTAALPPPCQAATPISMTSLSHRSGSTPDFCA